MVKRRAGNREQQRRRAAALPPEHSGTGSDPLTDSARKSLITQRAAALQRLESGRWARNRRKADAGPADATKRGPRKADGKRTRAASDPGLSRSARDRVQARPARAQHRPRVHADRRAPAPAAPDRIIARQRWEILEPHLLRLGLDIERTTARLRQFASVVLEWNGRVSNLISRSDAERVLERHILESVEPAHWLLSSHARTWLDFGSGGGFPAIPLAIVGVGSHWVLVESRRNKALFLRKAVQDLEIRNVEIVQGRLENLVGTSSEGEYDGFTSRATMTLVPTLELAAHFVRSGGSAFLWKGSRREEEMSESTAWRSGWELEGLLGVGGAQTVVSRFRRTPAPESAEADLNESGRQG